LISVQGKSQLARTLAIVVALSICVVIIHHYIRAIRVNDSRTHKVSESPILSSPRTSNATVSPGIPTSVTSDKSAVAKELGPVTRQSATLSTTTILAILKSKYNLGAHIDGNILIDEKRGNLFFSDYPHGDVTADLYRYDFKSDRLILMGMSDNLNVSSLSPDGSFAALDSGTDVSNRGLDIFDIRKNQYVLRTAGGGYHSSLVWSPDSTKYMIPISTYDISFPLCASGGSLDSVYVQNATDTALRTPLYAATASTSYDPVRWLDPTRVVVERNVYSMAFPSDGSDCSQSTHWEIVYGHPTSQFIQRDLVTGAESIVSSGFSP